MHDPAGSPPVTGAEATAEVIEAAIAGAMRRQSGKRLVIGLCGAQGSGKSTLAASLCVRLAAKGIGAVQLSLDDLYLTRAERDDLAARVHPLLRTRGVPGTHDVGLGYDLLASFRAGKPLRLPRFDKLRDDRLPVERWDESDGDARILLFEGWCVGARPQAEADLALPINALERDEDGGAIWRRFVNRRLAADYQQLFEPLDRLILLAAPTFEQVYRWRAEQEAMLSRSSGSEGAVGMDERQLARFIQHYERLTRHILAQMPAYADLTIHLDENRRLTSVTRPVP